MLKNLEQYNRISVNELDSINQTNRCEKRYILNKGDALNLIESIDNGYRLLSVDGDSVIGYEINYFDTSDFKLYKKHLYGRGNRYSIRKKSYSTSQKSYIDIKENSKSRKVNKYRSEFTSMDMFNQMVEDYTPYNSNNFEDKVAIHFNRFTFISSKYKEKITIDLDLGFSTDSEVRNFSSIAIVEVQREWSLFSTPFERLLKKYSCKSFNISKYCLAVYSMYPYMATESMKKRVDYLEAVLV